MTALALIDSPHRPGPQSGRRCLGCDAALAGTNRTGICWRCFDDPAALAARFRELRARVAAIPVLRLSTGPRVQPLCLHLDAGRPCRHPAPEPLGLCDEHRTASTARAA